MPRSGIAGSYDSSIFNFLRKLHTVFHSGCISLSFPSTVLSGSLFSTSLPTLIFCLFDDSHADGYKVMVSNCIFLMISDGEHLFMYSNTFEYLYFCKNIFRSYAHFLIELLGLFFFLLLTWVPYVFWILTFIRYMIFKYFLPFFRLHFHFVDSFIWKEAFYFVLIFAPVVFVLVSYPENHCQNWCQGTYPLCFLLGVICFRY